MTENENSGKDNIEIAKTEEAASFEEVPVMGADPGEPEVIYQLAEQYFNSSFTKKKKKALELYKNAYDLGVKDAASKLGNIYNEEKGFIDHEKAFYWLSKSVEDGHKDDLVSLGELYLYGSGTGKDAAKAYELFEQAEKEEEDLFGDALLHMAQMNLDGIGVPQNTGKGLSLLERLVEEDLLMSPTAAEKLGQIYEEGEEGVARNPEEAEKWYRKAADSDFFPSWRALAKTSKGRISLLKGAGIIALCVLGGSFFGRLTIQYFGYAVIPEPVFYPLFLVFAAAGTLSCIFLEGRLNLAGTVLLYIAVFLGLYEGVILPLPLNAILLAVAVTGIIISGRKEPVLCYRDRVAFCAMAVMAIFQLILGIIN